LKLLTSGEEKTSSSNSAANSLLPGVGQSLSLTASTKLNEPGSMALTNRANIRVPTPRWHAPWELSAVISGHIGWVRSIAFDPSNEWFVTGSADRTIKVSIC
jgi:pleiotropic regulator 1